MGHGPGGDLIHRMKELVVTSRIGGSDHMPLSESVQLEALRQQQIELVTRLNEVEAKLWSKALADDERRKQLVGGLILDHMATNRESALSLALRQLLDAGLKEPADRALFPALAPVPAVSKV
jgi:hypothetical protein